jgi:DNA-binding transcriptional regulator YiaG
MSHRQSSGKPRTVSASAILTALGNDLAQIKHEDGLTWADMARVMGKSEDQAAKYAEGSAEMSVTTFYFAKEAWNGRFTGTADQLVHRHRGATNDRSKCTIITEALLKISVALEDDEEVSPGEVRAIRKQLEQGRDVFDELLGRLPSPVRAA